MWDRNLITDEPLARCPIRLLLDAAPWDREAAYRLAYVEYPLFQGGHLLVAGAINDQPAVWLDAMLMLQTLTAQKKAAYARIQAQDEA